ncbi:hypothetical protein [Leptospira ilyithenensis]|uniref:Lipoprotein n=1 Tax=Leptospira ilyithenensis TaxID=2484901 RepID=A0A4R9LP15_9LEPT|nr:hypothetical protein [Leptospira ilyithenensis]TGN08487.1 hypothetical protein EHS11_16465 [Leptospira ilyithenensis]
MKKLQILLITLFILASPFACKLKDKSDNGKDLTDLLLLSFLTRSSSSNGCNPSTSFVICIPKGIAE